MAKRPHAGRKPTKRGPKEQLFLREDVPNPALMKFLRKQKQLADSAKRDFDAAHLKGMESLHAHDLKGVEKAIKLEAAAIRAFRKVTLPKKFK